jgi:hypothetical protein
LASIDLLFTTKGVGKGTGLGLSMVQTPYFRLDRCAYARAPILDRGWGNAWLVWLEEKPAKYSRGTRTIAAGCHAIQCRRSTRRVCAGSQCTESFSRAARELQNECRPSEWPSIQGRIHSTSQGGERSQCGKQRRLTAEISCWLLRFSFGNRPCGVSRSIMVGNSRANSSSSSRMV